MNKRVKKIFAIGILMVSIIGGIQVTQADASSIDTSSDFQQVSEVQLNEEYERIMNDTNLIKEKVIEASPLVKNLYENASNPIFEVFYLDEAKAVIADFSGNPPKEYSL